MLVRLKKGQVDLAYMVHLPILEKALLFLLFLERTVKRSYRLTRSPSPLFPAILENFQLFLLLLTM